MPFRNGDTRFTSRLSRSFGGCSIRKGIATKAPRTNLRQRTAPLGRDLRQQTVALGKKVLIIETFFPSGAAAAPGVL
jgi:hypothetical protein